jgi:hypothetical protein
LARRAGLHRLFHPHHAGAQRRARHRHPHQKKFRESQADLFGYLEERLAGTEDIRSSGAVDFVILGIYKLSYKMLGTWRSHQRRFVVVRLVAGMHADLGISMALFSGYTCFARGSSPWAPYT